MVVNLNTEIRDLINRYSRENQSNTPDWILANYICMCLEAFENATNAREAWHGREYRSEKQRIAK